jgi:hypothetical protein
VARLPGPIHELARKLKEQGHDPKSAYAIAVAAARKFGERGHAKWARAYAQFRRRAGHLGERHGGFAGADPSDSPNDLPTDVSIWADEWAGPTFNGRPLRPFEQLMSLEDAADTIDKAREGFQAAAQPVVLELARQAAEQAAKGRAIKLDPKGLEAALADELDDLYAFGRRMVADELARQAGSVTDVTESYAISGGGLGRFARLAAKTIVARIQHALERLTLTDGKPDQAVLQEVAEREAAAGLKAEATLSAAAAVNAGRTDEAEARADEIRGSLYTSILDKNRCEQCAKADDDVLRTLDDPVRRRRRPPNPDCYGGHRCRCMEFFVLKREAPSSFDDLLAFDFDPDQPRDDHGRWVATLRLGDRVELHDGVDVDTNERVPMAHGPVVRKRDQTVMINAGTPRKPRWVYGSGAQVQPRQRKKPADVRRQLVQPRDLFTDDQRAALRDYTGGKGSVAEELNASLRRGTKSRLHESVREQLDSAFAAVPPLSEDGVVYRGTKVRGAQGLDVGAVVEDRGYMSTSPSRNQAEDFVAYSNGDLFEIVLPEGAKALDMNEAAGSRFGREREVLLPRGTRMAIEEIRRHPKRDKARVIRARVLL